MSDRNGDGEALLTPAEVAALFRVDPKTVTRWAKAGKLSAIRTLGGHRRYRATEVYALLDTVAPVNPPQQPRTAHPQVPQQQRVVRPAPAPAMATTPRAYPSAR